jgi:hypothetical protein
MTIFYYLFMFWIIIVFFIYLCFGYLMPLREEVDTSSFMYGFLFQFLTPLELRRMLCSHTPTH